MASGKSIAFGIAVVLVILIIYKYKGKSTFRNKPRERFTPASRPRSKQNARRERMVGSPGPMDAAAAANANTSCPRAPYTAIQNQIGLVRGNPDATSIMNQGRPAMKAYDHSSALLTPEALTRAEQESWALAAEQDQAAPHDIEKMTDMGDDTMQAHATAPALNYDDMITDLVVDPRTKLNHMMWVDEMQGWSGTTTMKVDNFEPQLYLNWVGLRLPQAGVGQYNPLQLTEVDDTMLAVNKDFRFNS